MSELTLDGQTIRKHPLAELLQLDYAYFAGLLDGEGWFGSSRTGRSIAPRIQIGMTNLDVLQWCQSRFGGSIHTMRKGSRRIKDAWKWNMSSNAIRLHIPLTIPYLKVKRRQAELVVDWVTNGINFTNKRCPDDLIQKQEEFQCRLKMLNAL